MSSRIRTVVVSAAAFLAVQGCAAREAPVATAHAPFACEGGRITAEDYAASYADCAIIHGSLEVVGTSLSSLAPFANVQHISGSLIVRDNDRLESVVALGQLRSVQSIEITGNPALASLAGLERIPSLDRLVLERNGLYDTQGLEGLSEVGALVVRKNPKLISLGGLSGLTRADSVEIVGNPRLCASLGMLPALREVKGELHVSRNVGLSESDVSDLTVRARSKMSVANNDPEG